MLRVRGIRGFTLIELMIILALLAIVATIAVPNFMQFIRNNQVQAKADEVKTFLQYARGQAVGTRRNYQVTTGEQSWAVGPVGGSEERSLEFNTAQAIASVNAETIIFNPNGSVSNAAEIAVCRASDAENGYFIEIQPSGMVRMQPRGVNVPSNCEVE